MSDSVEHPPYYNSHPSGVEAIEVCEHLHFCLGNAVKYVWRAGLKGASAGEDLRKAAWYLKRDLTWASPVFVPIPGARDHVIDRVVAAEVVGSVLRYVLAELPFKPGWSYKVALGNMLARVEGEIASLGAR